MRTARQQSRPVPAWPFWLLLLAAVLHAFLGVHEGLEDGDYSLLYLAAPMMVLTAGAAVASRGAARWSAATAVVLTAVSLSISLLLVTAYGLGLFHLPQSLLALGIAVRSAERST